MSTTYYFMSVLSVLWHEWTYLRSKQCDQIGTASVCGSPNSLNSLTPEILNFCSVFVHSASLHTQKPLQKFQISRVAELRSLGVRVVRGGVCNTTSTYYPNSLTSYLLNSATLEIWNFCWGFCVRSSQKTSKNWGFLELGN